MAKVMISLPDEFLKAVDAVSRAEHRTRSELIREAVRAYLQKGQPYMRPIDNPAVQQAFESIRATKWRGTFDSTQLIRRLRETRYAR
ncbi:MAG: hypothetical protein C3F08_08185 [Candidatus Methylomirabilota bacterium]|nr:MAG: hypothetical protein C3F08_08185 [candidate division NC10 bacterium]